MKPKHPIIAAALAVSVFALASADAAVLAAPVPEFRSQTQLRNQIVSAASEGHPNLAGENVFYTGKVEDTDCAEYLFLFRNYNPTVARWTTCDPSGFPDGANSNVYAERPTSQFDPNGFAVINYSTQIESIASLWLGGVAGYTVNRVRPEITTSFSLGTPQQSGNCYYVSATAGYSFTGQSDRHLPEVGSSTAGGVVSQQFHSDIFRHETWHQDIYVAYMGSIYESLEAWSSSYVSERFSSSSAATAAAQHDLQYALETTARSFESLYGTMQDQHPQNGASVQGGQWVAYNPDWGLDSFNIVSGFQPDFETTPGVTSCE